VNNLFDNEVIVDSSVSGEDGNTFAELFPSQGRFIFVGFTANF